MPFKELNESRQTERSESIRARVTAARQIQEKRFQEIPGVHCNAQMSSSLMRKICTLDDPCQHILKKAMEKLGLSARAFDRIIKMSRTIADIDNQQEIRPEHLAEAIQYRSLDRDSWGK